MKWLFLLSFYMPEITIWRWDSNHIGKREVCFSYSWHQSNHSNVYHPCYAKCHKAVHTKDLKDGLKCKESEPVSFIKNLLKLQIWWPFKFKLDSYLAESYVIW